MAPGLWSYPLAPLPARFNGRRLREHQGEWFLLPTVKGKIASRTPGDNAFVDPRAVFQPARKTLKPKEIRPVPNVYRKKNDPRWYAVPESEQRAKAGDGAMKHLGRWYPRPTSRKTKGPQAGKIVGTAYAGPVWFHPVYSDKAQDKGPQQLEPLNESQLEALRFACWAERKYPDPAKRVQALVRDHGALVVIHSSGGKDSQAMYLYVTRELGIRGDQIRVVHADLPGADWPGTLEHIRDHVDEPVAVEVARYGDRDKLAGQIKTFDSYVLKRGKWPSAAMRFCTSDLKRGILDARTRAEVRELNGVKSRQGAIPKDGRRIVINAMGMRAQESPDREKLEPWELSLADSLNNRIWWDWLPIHAWKVERVFSTIKRHGQVPFWIYGQTPEHRRKLIAGGAVDEKGRAIPMTRMSCTFCVLASGHDIGVASLLAPKRAAEVCAIEEKIGHTFKPGISFRELVSKAQEQVKRGTKTAKGKRVKGLEVLA